MSWDILKDKTQIFEIFYLVNKIRFVFYVTIHHPDISNSYLGFLLTFKEWVSAQYHKPRQTIKETFNIKTEDIEFRK